MPLGLQFHTECSVTFDQAINKKLIFVKKIGGIKMVFNFSIQKIRTIQNLEIRLLIHLSRNELVKF